MNGERRGTLTRPPSRHRQASPPSSTHPAQSPARQVEQERPDIHERERFGKLPESRKDRAANRVARAMARRHEIATRLHLQTHYESTKVGGLVKLVGPEFSQNDVGFVFPINSTLRKRADGALLAMREDGTYRRIYGKWFGTQ